MNGPQHSIEQLVPKSLVEELHALVDRPIRVMVICGTQTRTLLKYRDDDILPDNLEIVSGPGCSICVMPAGHIDAFIKIAKQPDVITATCEDLLRVQGSRESLASVKNKGALVEVVDAPVEALDLARKHPSKIVVFTAVGFEGAAPDVAETILEAASEGIDNFCVIPSIRLLPPSLDSLMRDPELNIRGLLCSAHILSITDSSAYAALAKRRHLSCAVTCRSMMRSNGSTCALKRARKNSSVSVPTFWPAAPPLPSARRLACPVPQNIRWDRAWSPRRASARPTSAICSENSDRAGTVSLQPDVHELRRPANHGDLGRAVKVLCLTQKSRVIRPYRLACRVEM
jgi:hypothetical protein